MQAITQMLNQQQAATQLVVQQSEAQQSQQQHKQQLQMQQELEQLKRLVQEQQQQLQTQQEQHRKRSAQTQIKKKKKKKAPKMTDTSSYTNKITELQNQIENLLREESEYDFQHKTTLDRENARLASVQAQLDAVSVSVSQEREKSMQLQLDIQRQVEENESLDQRLKTTSEEYQLELKMITLDLANDLANTKEIYEHELSKADSQYAEAQNLNQSLRTEVNLYEDKIIQQIELHASLEVHIRNCETVRKRLHNEIQELKGNVRVICRVRPLLGKETGEGTIFTFPKGSQELNIETTNVKDFAGRSVPGKKLPFKFDRVFPPNTCQKDVFEEISHLVQSSLDGFNCCIFAYGQTGIFTSQSIQRSINL